MMELNRGHQSVLLNEAIRELCAATCPGLYMDGTFGGGGHTRAILEANVENRVVAFDCDPAAIERAQPLQEEFGERLQVVQRNFAEMDQLKLEGLEGALFDFGLSSYHYDTAERGFSFRLSGPVDMRLNPDAGIPAWQFLETAEREELVRAIRNYGEEQRWKAVVRAIEEARGSEQLRETTALAALIEKAVEPSGPRGPRRIHPATRSFQGIRIAVNRELEVIETVLPKAFNALKDGGRLVAISFHSLEDRLVKRYMRGQSGRAVGAWDNTPQQLREINGEMPFNRPTVPTEEECEYNPRARSARMRVLIRRIRS